MSTNPEIPRRAWLALTASAPLLRFGDPHYVAQAGDALDSLRKARAALKSLAAKFKQVGRSQASSDEIRCEGELTIVVPNQLRWDLAAPFDVTYWANPKGVAFASRIPSKRARPPAGGFGAALTDLYVVLAGDPTTLGDRYGIASIQEDDGSVSATLRPVDPKLKEHLARLTVRSNPARWGVAALRIDEPGGTSLSIHFDANEKDPKVDPDRMRPPTG